MAIAGGDSMENRRSYYRVFHPHSGIGSSRCRSGHARLLPRNRCIFMIEHGFIGVAVVTTVDLKRYTDSSKDINMPTRTLTPQIISAAIDGFEVQKRRIADQIAELRAMLSGSTEAATTTGATPRKGRKMSAASRRKMALSQKARWAQSRGTAEPSAPDTVVAAKTKRRISKEGMARIIAATKKRWAAVRAIQAKSAATKNVAPAGKKVAVKKASNKSASVKNASAKTSVPVVAPATRA
jgi:hypothetical protein